MHKLLDSKEGGEKIFSIWWFLILALTGGGIIIGVVINTSSNVDVRSFESRILNEQIYDCIVQGGVISSDFLEENFDIYSCGLKKELFSKGSDYYFRIILLDEEGDLLRDTIAEGDASFEGDCGIQGSRGSEKNLPQCFPFLKKQISYYDSLGEVKTGTLDILTASNQAGKKVTLHDE